MNILLATLITIAFLYAIVLLAIEAYILIEFSYDEIVIAIKRVINLLK